MKIDKQKLVDLLVKKTGMDLDQVEEQLNELIGRIQEAAEKGKALEIKGFGMFYFSTEGDLKFDPSEDLQTEANYKYAGMEPVEIKKPRESSDDSVTESELKDEAEESTSLRDDVWGFDEESEEDDGKTEEKSEIKPADSTGKSESEPAGDGDDEELKEDKKKKEEEEAYDPFADFDHGYVKPEEENPAEKGKDETKEPVKKKKLSEKADETKSDELDEIFSSLHEEQKKKETAEKIPAGKKVPGRTAMKSRAKKNNPVFNLVALIVAVLVIIMGIIIANDLGYLDSVFGSADAPGEVVQSEPPPQSPVETDPTIDAADEPESEEMPADEEVENGSVTPEQPDPSAIEDIEQPDTPEFGLYGTAEVIDDRYYSIILHSVRSENRAQEVRDELQNEGYRSVITSVNSEDLGTMWRVGIGQFETIPDAQNAAVELPQNYRDNHFIGLIQ